MIEIFEWFTAEPSMWATVAKWAAVPAVAVVAAWIVWLMVAAQRVDQASKGRGVAMAAAVPFAGGKVEQKPARANYVARIPGRAATPAPAVVLGVEAGEGAKVLPFLPRAEREARRAGGWS